MKEKKFTSNNNWFELTYPHHWTEFDEEDGTYLFMDNENWKGNLRITAMRLETANENSKKEYLTKHLADEIKEGKGAKKIRLGDKEAVYYITDLEQDGEKFKMYNWTTGAKTTLLICSFTIDKNRIDDKEIKKELEYAIKTLASIKVLDESGAR